MKILKQAEQWPFRCAAVNQDLVDRLKGEFRDWHKKQPRGSIFGGGMIGGLDHWPNVESFLKDRYPEAHRNLDMGYEEVRPLLDNGYGADAQHPLAPYPTGPEAVAKHGYDPKEIAAGMLLLHNKTDRFRGDMSQEDQARLNDISQKRHKMQQDYEQRQLVGVQQMSPNISLQHIPHPNGGGGSIVRAYDTSQNWLGEPKKVGELAHSRSGKIVWVNVDPDYQRQGIASAMLEHARAQQPGIYHAPNRERSDESRAWAKAVP